MLTAKIFHDDAGGMKRSILILTLLFAFVLFGYMFSSCKGCKNKFKGRDDSTQNPTSSTSDTSSDNTGDGGLVPVKPQNIVTPEQEIMNMVAERMRQANGPLEQSLARAINGWVRAVLANDDAISAHWGNIAMAERDIAEAERDKAANILIKPGMATMEEWGVKSKMKETEILNEIDRILMFGIIIKIKGVRAGNRGMVALGNQVALIVQIIAREKKETEVQAKMANAMVEWLARVARVAVKGGALEASAQAAERAVGKVEVEYVRRTKK
jgi:hypothetical protein